MSFVPAHTTVTARGAHPDRVVYVLHGILGSGRNWRTLCRRLVDRRPDLACVLVDLRNHGDSDGAPGPHTLTATADDLLALAPLVGPPSVVIGHSFGGKVALRYAERHGDGLDAVWVLDSRADDLPPEPDNEVRQVIDALHAVDVPLPDREALLTALRDHGFSELLARWMTTNLRRGEDGYVWAFDLPAIDEMIDDYWRTDLWPVLRAPPCPIHLVRAGRSDRWPDDVVHRYMTESHPAVTVHTLPEAGHWLHVDDPDGLLALLAET